MARLWIDGVLTNNLERGACGITPRSGYKPWCDPVELDGLWGGNTGVVALQWGANRTDGSGIKFTIGDRRREVVAEVGGGLDGTAAAGIIEH